MPRHFALPALHERQLAHERVLDRLGARELRGQTLRARQLFGRVAADRAERLEHFRDAALLAREHGLILNRRRQTGRRAIDVALELRDLRRDRQQLRLTLADTVEPLTDVGHFDVHRVAEVAQRFHFGAPARLVIELLVDVGRHHVERIQAGLDALHELLMPGEPDHLPVEVVGDTDELIGFRRALFDHREAVLDRFHAAFEFRHLHRERAHAREEGLERHALGES